MDMKNKGFTLIELVIVIAVLGLLAGIAIPRFLNASASAKGAKVLANLRSIDSAVNLYMTKNGTVPTMAQLTADDNTKLLDISTGYNEGMFLVKTNDGREKEYNDSGDYGISPDGRGYLQAPAHTADYYLAGLETSLAANMDKIIAALKDVNKTSVDSFSRGQGTAQLLAALKAQGIDLNALGATSWSYINGKSTTSNRLLFTPINISSLPAGAQVPIIQYNPNSGNYSVWTGKVASHSDPDVNGGAPYNRIEVASPYKPSTTSQKQTYEDAINFYNDLAKEMGY